MLRALFEIVATEPVAPSAASLCEIAAVLCLSRRGEYDDNAVDASALLARNCFLILHPAVAQQTLARLDDGTLTIG